MENKKRPLMALPEIAAALLIFFFAQLAVYLLFMVPYMLAQTSELLGEDVSINEANKVIYEKLQSEFLPAHVAQITIITAILGLGLLFLAVKKIDPPALKNLGFVKPPKYSLIYVPSLGIGLQIFIALAVSAVLSASGMEELREQMESYSKALNGPNAALSIIAVVIAAPLNEEIFFRGAIMRSMEKHGFSNTASVLIQAALFGVFHVIPVQIAYAFVIGVVLGFLRSHCGSIWPCVLLHVCFNCAAYWGELCPDPGIGLKIFLFVVSALVIFSSLWLTVKKGGKARDEA